MVVSGNKRARTAMAGVEMKAISSSKRRGVWGNAEDVAHRHQMWHEWIDGYINYNKIFHNGISPKAAMNLRSCAKII